MPPSLCACLLLAAAVRAADPGAAPAAVAVSSGAAQVAPPAPAPQSPQPPAWAKPLHGVHLTGWGAGAPKVRRALIRDLKGAGLNAVVIALKEYDGYMFVRGVPLAHETRSYVNAIPDLPACVREFKEAGIYTIGRIVLFKDNYLARHRPDLAVRKPGGGIWANANGVAWVDPYRREIWDYNLAIASRAAAAGFDEIQFDYLRFPSDGNTRLCRYSRADHSNRTSRESLAAFLALARERLQPLGVKLSICVFGMTTTDDSGMGIGQHISALTRQVDFISPMMYPSHYHKGIYGLKNPNREPYKTIAYGTRDAVARLGADAWRLRPYFQDFSLGFRYNAEQVRAQILAAARQGVTNWILWNPQNRYTWSALRHNNQPIHAAKPVRRRENPAP
ncbi:MAG: putative glycoside hydrolase [Elusimicrobia bacterium]|nr:putative glycoside hydrolase [Elusimicrobiota bacterium]